jgi:hypothetical protein
MAFGLGQHSAAVSHCTSTHSLSLGATVKSPIAHLALTQTSGVAQSELDKHDSPW